MKNCFFNRLELHNIYWDYPVYLPQIFGSLHFIRASEIAAYSMFSFSKGHIKKECVSAPKIPTSPFQLSILNPQLYILQLNFKLFNRF